MEDRESKAAVNYSRGKGETICANCSHWLPFFLACEKVKGWITPNMWCELWQRMPHDATPTR